MVLFLDVHCKGTLLEGEREKSFTAGAIKPEEERSAKNLVFVEFSLEL